MQRRSGPSYPDQPPETGTASSTIPKGRLPFPGWTTTAAPYATVENGMVLHRFWDLASCTAFALKPQCTTGKEWRVTRWERERVIEAMQERMDRAPKMQVRRATVEHPFRTLKARMGSTRFLTKTLAKVRTEMSLRLRLQREKTDQHPRHQTADERFRA